MGPVRKLGSIQEIRHGPRRAFCQSRSGHAPHRPFGSGYFQTWIDGLGPGPNQPGNASGGVVGYPMTDRDAWGPVRHSGVKSMPFNYDNTIAPYYSETERTWDTPQDWTVDGVDTLTLYVLGDAGNTTDGLYVAIEDAEDNVAAAVHPDPEAVLAPEQAVGVVDEAAEGRAQAGREEAGEEVAGDEPGQSNCWASVSLSRISIPQSGHRCVASSNMLCSPRLVEWLFQACVTFVRVESG